MGQDRRGPRLGPGHAGGLAAHRHHGRRRHRQDATDLCTRRFGATGRHAHHRRGGWLRPAGVDDPGALLRRGRHHGRQRQRPAVADHPQHAAGLGADAASRHRPGSGVVLVVHPAAVGPLS